MKPFYACARLAFPVFLALSLAACGTGGELPGEEVVESQPSASWEVLGDGPGAWAWSNDVAAISLGGSDAAVIGGYIGTMILAEGTPEEVSLTSVSWQDAYLARVGAQDGRLQWVVAVNSSPNGWAVIQDVVETAGGIAVAGYFDDEATFLDPTGAVAHVLQGDSLDDGFVAHYDLDGNLLWAHSVTGPGYVECLALCARSDGSLCVGGVFEGVMTPDGQEFTYMAAGQNDSFVATYAPDGTLLWGTQFAGDPNGFASAWSLASLDLPGQDVIVAGDFQGTANFGLGGSRASVNGSIDSFLVRLDGTTGALVWVQTVGGVGVEQAQDVALAVQGGTAHIRMTGGFAETAEFGQPGGNQVVLTSAGMHDGFIAAFDGSGDLQWAHSVGGPGEDYLYDASVNATDGSLIAIGHFTGTAAFSNSPDVLVSHGNGDVDAMLVGIAADGSVSWCTAMGGTGDDYGLGIASVPATPGDVYATGMVSGPEVTLDPAAGPLPIQGGGGGFQIRFKAE